jgi:hypothetical protein
MTLLDRQPKNNKSLYQLHNRSLTTNHTSQMSILTWQNLERNLPQQHNLFKFKVMEKLLCLHLSQNQL